MRKFKVIPFHKQLKYEAPYMIVLASDQRNINYKGSRLNDFPEWGFLAFEIKNKIR